MKRLTSLMEGIAVGVVLAISLLVVPAAAQMRPDPGPEEELTPRTACATRCAARAV